MEVIKFEHELGLCDVIEENLHKTMEKLKSAASDVMLLNIQWSDLEDYLKSTRETLEKRYREVVSKEDELQKRSLALEERVKVVEAAEAEMIDLEMKSNVLRSEAEERGEELCVLRKLLEECSDEHMSKTGQLNELSELLSKIQTEVDLKRKQLEQMDFVLERQRGESSAELQHLHRSQSRNKELDAEIERKKEDYTSRSAEYEKQLKSVEEQLTSQQELLEKQSLELVTIKEETCQQLQSKNKELEEIERLIQERTGLNDSKEAEQLKLKASLMEREKELALKEKAFRARSENIELKKKKLDDREERLNKRDEQLKSEEKYLGKCVKDYELKTKKLASFCQQNKPDQQVDLARDASVRDEKTLQLLLHECKEIRFGLQGMNDPAGYVLSLVKDELMSAQRRGELSLTEPIVKHLVSLLEELPHVVRSSKHLLSDALQVADRWSRMLDNSSQMSPLEVWGFLQLIVAYELVYRTNRDSTLRFALKVAHFKQAPKLFESLGLSYAILELVKQLLDKRHYLLAIRFILYFNLTYSFNYLKFLKDQIFTLRLSAKYKFDSQAEDRDAAKLKDIIELIDEFKLEIDLPVELVVKFMVPREIQNQNPYVVSSIVPVQATFPTILGRSPTQQVLQLETYQAGGSTIVHGQSSSHQAGHKRPRVDPSVSGHMIRPCFNQSSYDRV